MKKPNKQQHQGKFHGTIDEQLKFLENLEKHKPPVVMEQSIGFQIASTATRLRIEMLRKFKKYDYEITPEQGHVLNTIRDSEGISQSEIADRTMKDKPTITRILDILEKKKMIGRHPDENDRRIYKIFLTKEGREQIDIFGQILAEVDSRAFRGLGEREIRALREILHRIRINIEHGDDGTSR